MGIPTQKQIVDRKRTVKARKVNLEKRESKRVAEGREPDNKTTRRARKTRETEHLEVQKRTRTEAQKQTRKADEQIRKLLSRVKDLEVVDPDTLLDLVSQDKDTDKRTQYIDLMQVLELKDQGMSNVAIAKVVGTTINRLRGLLRRYSLVSAKIQSFKGHRADIFADFQRRLLKSITDADLRRSSVGSRLLALCHLYDKERLEKDLSTANVVTLHDDIAAVKRQAQQALEPVSEAEVVEPLALPGPARPDQADHKV